MPDTGTSEEVNPDDLSILENILRKLYALFEKKSSEMKVGDILKVIELKHKLTVTGPAERKFWAMIEQVRREKLPASPGVGKSSRKGKAAPREAKAI